MTTIKEMHRSPEQPVTDPAAFKLKIVNSFNEYFDSKTSMELYMEIFWWSLIESDRQNVETDWENSLYVRIFLDKFREIYLNCNTHTIQPLICGEVTAQEVVVNGL